MSSSWLPAVHWGILLPVPSRESSNPPTAKANPLRSLHLKATRAGPFSPFPLSLPVVLGWFGGYLFFPLKIFKLLFKIQLFPRKSVPNQPTSPSFVGMKSLCLPQQKTSFFFPQGEERPSLKIMGLSRGLKERSCFVA